MKLVEAVINISCGNDSKILNECKDAVEGAGGYVLDIDGGEAAGRTVLTIAAELTKIKAASFALIEVAIKSIDMFQHTGVHPCIGAADICPLVPLAETTSAECEEVALELAKEVGEKLSVPTFLYGKLAKIQSQAKLSVIRRGDFPALQERLAQGEIIPDFGPSTVGSAGGCIIGVRKLMLAYNINLEPKAPLEVAKAIAAKIRSSGQIKRDDNGKIVRDASGTPLREAGMFPNLEAIGWFIDDFNCCQISTNIRDITNPDLASVYEATKKLAGDFGYILNGSEVVGLLPKQALLTAGEYYINGGDFIDAAIKALGLDSVKPFNPREKILEFRIEDLMGIKL